MTRIARLRLILGTGLILIPILLLLLAMGCGSPHGSTLYHCPMHPTFTSDKPGDCAICGMRLVPVETRPVKGGAAAGEAGAVSADPSPKPTPGDKVMYRSTMNPNEVSDHPGKDSMGMEMVPFTVETPATRAVAPPKTMWRSTMNPNEVSDHPGKDSMGMDMVPFTVEQSAAGMPQGLATVSVTPDEARRIGLTYGIVEERPLAQEVRTSARIQPDETRLHRVNTKVGGWVDRLYVDTTGQAVRAGQPLLSIYSPELVASEQELLSAFSAARELSKSPYAQVSEGGRDLLESAKRRLKLWDITDAQIERILKTGAIEKDVTLYAPSTGYVTEKDVLPGQRINPGDPLMVVADLSTVWAESDIYESDLPFIKVGMPVKVTLPYWPGKVFEGTVSLLNPFLDPMTRTLKARLIIPNHGLDLKPEMYGNAVLSYDLGVQLAVPDTAILPTGEHNYAFLLQEDGSLRPVDVKIGQRAGGYYEVLSGLTSGQRVVTSANFLIDSESSLKAALQAVAGK